MSSTDFAQNFVRGLSVSRPASPPPLDYPESSLSEPASPVLDEVPIEPSHSPRKPALHALLVAVNQGDPICASEVAHCVKQFKEILLGHHDEPNVAGSVPRSLQIVSDNEEETMKEEILKKLTVAIYTDALEAYMAQAVEVEAEAEWWGDIESSSGAVLWYSIQSFPSRLLNLTNTIISMLQAELHDRQESFSLSALSPSALRRLLSPSSTTFRFSLQPGVILTALFPYLRGQSENQNLSLAVFVPPPSRRSLDASTNVSPLTVLITRAQASVTRLWRFTILPFKLTRQECRYKRKALEKIRDDRAATLGQLALMRGGLGFVSPSVHHFGIDGRKKQYTSFLDSLIRVISPVAAATRYEDTDPLSLLTRLSTVSLPGLKTSHVRTLRKSYLLRPSAFTLFWPHLLVIPPLSLYIYTSRSDWIPKLVELSQDAGETIRGFVEGWLIQPLADILGTVRGNPAADRARIVSEEGVASDLESLQRMSRSLATDFLGYDQVRLDALAVNVAKGDMTPIMEIYEEDMRSPIKGMFRGGGRLVRGVLLQVQKAKVDIDYALRGIDHLLKSQELTFAFVGLSPALLIVYLAAGGLRGLWRGGRIGGRFGGKRRRHAAWEGIRRIEKLLILQSPSVTPPSSSTPQISSASLTTDLDKKVIPSPPTSIPPLPTGLLLLSLLRLRTWASAFLPTRIREPILEDLDMLEDPELGRDEKLLVIGRVWRVWREIGH